MTVQAAGPSSPSPFPLRFPFGSPDPLKRPRVGRGVAPFPILLSTFLSLLEFFF